MDMTDREAEPQFSRPLRQVVLMLVSVALFSAAAYLAYPQVAPVFLANPYLNGVIGLVFVIGLVACFLQVAQLITSVRWIEDFTAGHPGHDATRAPRLMAPLAGLLRKRGKRMQIGTASARSILDSVASRIEEARDITRYITSLLIFLGLLGTFYGLATTVPAVVDTIRSLAPQDGEGGVEVFARLMSGLEAQLGGMGTAFASSLLGLAGSLVVGLLELFVGHGQNRFYQELEEWLSTITRVGFSTGEGEGEGEAGAETGVLAGTLDQLADQMQGLHGLFARSDAARNALEGRVATLADAVETLGVAMEAQLGDAHALAEVLARVAEGQDRAATAIEARMGEEGTLADAEARMRLRSIDVQLLRILEELAAGRQETVTALRGDLADLGRALAGLAPHDGRRG